MDDLKSCYEQMKLVLGNSIEPFESVLLVEKIRQFWKPERVKVILLAESHVFTTDDDRVINLPALNGLMDFPLDYAKFVYCLGYGERELTQSLVHPKRDGTPQFWKIFYSCLNYVDSNASFFAVLKSKTQFEQRVINKIELLKALRHRGIWLVDASICALYKDGNKPNNYLMTSAITTSWLNYTKAVVEEANPEHIIIIGKGVAKNVETDVRKLMGDRYSVIEQPNAHLSAEEHLRNYRKYYQLCNRF